MKKTQGKINYFNFIFSMCLFLFNFSSCGIDNITVIDEPKNTRHTPGYENTDFAESYFEFYTNEKNADSYIGCDFLGTEVYYKIYSDASAMTSERDALVNAATSDSTSASSASKMIDSYGFKALKVTNQKKSTLIPSKKTDQRVYIRLTDYQDSPDFAARITTTYEEDGNTVTKNLTGTDAINIPLRNFDDNVLTFNFGRSSVNAEKNKVPVSGDGDLKYSSNATDGKWYVVMFAVGVAKDVTYTQVYSNIMHIGDVTIDSNSYDN